jgi:hypothetical protein
MTSSREETRSLLEQAGIRLLVVHDQEAGVEKVALGELHAFSFSAGALARIISAPAPTLLLLADLVADDAADCRTADGADRAAAGEHRAPERSGCHAARGVLVASRHSAATDRAENHCRGNRTD